MQEPSASNELLDNTPPIDTAEKAPEFSIQRVYIKDMSFETPHSPHVFQEDWHPQIDIQLNTAVEKLAQDTYEVKLIVTVTAKLQTKVAFLVEAQQAGIFTLAHFPENQLHRMLGSYCPNILFPFAREVISDLIIRGGFPPMYLSPINFDVLYDQQLQKQQQAQTATEQ